MSRIALSLLLFSAGLLHLLTPRIFDPLIPFEPKWMINLFSGILEIGLASGLMTKKYRDMSARFSALWFLCLTPLHIYISFKLIPVFGTNNPYLLWGRTALQPVLYFWALSEQNKSWIMAQDWKDVLFFHYEVEEKLLQKHVPFPLDLYNGKAIVSIVSFKMDNIRFPFLPVVPALSRLNELNLRTYVEVDGLKGIYFFTLDSDSSIANFIARTFFSLPYRFAEISLQLKNNSYFFKSHSLSFEAEIGSIRKSSAFDIWATERYGLFTKNSAHTLHGVVQHVPWELQDVEVKNLTDDFSNLLGEHLKAHSFIGTGYSKELKVRFRPFYKLD